MQNINFYDPSLRMSRDWLDADHAAATFGALLLALAAAGFYLHRQVVALRAPAGDAAATLETRRNALTALARRIGDLRADAAIERQLLGLQATLKQRQGALKTLGKGGVGEGGGYAASLLALAQQSIDGLWLTGVSMDQGDLALRGRTLRPELIAAYVGRLNGEAALRGHAFRALDVRRPPAEDAAPAAASAPAGPPRLAPYVEFSLVGARGTGAEPAPPEVRR